MRWSLTCLLSGVVSGAIGGVLWAGLAEPSLWSVTDQGLTMGQDASRGQFSVVVTFTLVGLAVATLWGLALALASRGVRWWMVPVIGVTALAAALIAWQLGMMLGPPDPSTVAGLAPGDEVPDVLSIDTSIAFMAWPFGGVLGLFLAGSVVTGRSTPTHLR